MMVMTSESPSPPGLPCARASALIARVRQRYAEKIEGVSAKEVKALKKQKLLKRAPIIKQFRPTRARAEGIVVLRRSEPDE